MGVHRGRAFAGAQFGLLGGLPQLIGALAQLPLNAAHPFRRVIRDGLQATGLFLQDFRHAADTPGDIGVGTIEVVQARRQGAGVAAQFAATTQIEDDQPQYDQRREDRDHDNRQFVRQQELECVPADVDRRIDGTEEEPEGGDRKPRNKCAPEQLAVGVVGRPLARAGGAARQATSQNGQLRFWCFHLRHRYLRDGAVALLLPTTRFVPA